MPIVTDEKAFQFPSKIASGAEIVAAAIAWRNADNKMNSPIIWYMQPHYVGNQHEADRAWDEFLYLLDTRLEVKQ